MIQWLDAMRRLAAAQAKTAGAIQFAPAAIGPPD
jgi:hypothetical protein